MNIFVWHKGRMTDRVFMGHCIAFSGNGFLTLRSLAFVWLAWLREGDVETMTMMIWGKGGDKASVLSRT
jgi:hypothetical protein